MRGSINSKAKKMIVGGMVATLPIISNVNISNADSNLESELTSFVDRYDVEDVTVENGVSVRQGEILDLSKYPGWEMSNEDTVDISENDVVTPIDEGTVFLGNEINDRLHIVEVYVPSENQQPMLRSNHKRDYYKVFVDAGHGGSDPGYSGHGHDEDIINLAIAKLVEDKLENKNIKIEVKMSRESDKFLSLSQRAQMANNYGADLFVSIHNNGADIASAHGIETFYHKNKSSHKPLANEVQTNAIKQTNARDRGVKTANFAVLRETTMPAILFEGGFMTNAEEVKKLSDPAYQNKLATAIADGVQTYLIENIKLDGQVETPDNVINTGVVTANSLNVRSGYGTNHSLIGKLSKGEKVEIVESKNGWHKIKHKGAYGYVSGSYIKVNSDTTNPEVPDTSNPPQEVIGSGVVTTNSLNVRSGYGTNHSVIGKLSKNDKVEIVESKNGWHKIKHSGAYGYVSGSYIKVNSDTTNPEVPDTSNPPQEVIGSGVVTTNSLNVRSGYGTNHSVIGKLSKNAKVEIVESKNGWHKIKYNGAYGYVSGSYIKVNSDTTNPEVPDIPNPPQEVTKGVVTANTLNVRSGYGTNYSTIGRLSKGTNVEIVESKNGWHKIKYNGTYGYVSGSYIKTSSTEVPQDKQIGTVTANVLNMRSGAGTNYSVVTKLSRGTKVEIIDSQGDWYKVKYTSSYGYVSKEYIKL